MEKRDVQINIRLTAKELEELDSYCEQVDLKRAQVVRKALKNFFEQNK